MRLLHLLTQYGVHGQVDTHSALLIHWVGATLNIEQVIHLSGVAHVRFSNHEENHLYYE